MLKNYLKTTLRNIVRHKVYSFINIAGFSVGMACCILIFLWVQHELSYDKFNKKFNRIYRVVQKSPFTASMAPAVGKGITEHIPEAEKVVRFNFRHDYLIKYQLPNNQSSEKLLTIRTFAYVDPTVFDVFTLPLILGDAKTALKDPFSLVLTESISERLFGSENPIGKTVKVNNLQVFQITGVMKDVENFHLTFDSLSSFETLRKIEGDSEVDSFRFWNLPTYVLLPENHDKTYVAKKITRFFHKRMVKLYHKEVQFELFPLKDIYFSNLEYGKHGNMQSVYIFIAIAIFVLLIACFNFINLSTARASLRAREVGIKKVIGSSRFQLIIQFLSESALFSVSAFLGAILLVEILLPEFNNLIMGNLTLDILKDPIIIFCLIAGVFFIGIISGIYPAFYLSSFEPVTVLKGEKTKGTKSTVFRRTLIIFQFSISIIMIIGTLIVFNQIKYVKNKRLGFNKKNILIFDIHKDASVYRNKQDFRNRLLKNPNILNVSFSNGRPGGIYNNESFEYKSEKKVLATITVDPNFLDLYGLQIIKGRNFSPKMKTDEYSTCIMNETAIKEFGLESPVGTVFHHDKTDGSSFPSQDVKVIGVVKDFHFESLHENIRPLVFGWNDSWLWMANIQISSSNKSDTIDFIERIWKEFSPEFLFEYHFLDELFDRQYKNDERFGRIIGYFALLGVVIASLGLFGLTSFLTEKRTKEIGIRKVLGASVSNILYLLTKEFTKWVLIANIIAWPVAYYAMHRWLQNFAYRTNIGIFTFIISALLAMTIALLTVSYLAIKAALANPIEALRYE